MANVQGTKLDRVTVDGKQMFIVTVWLKQLFKVQNWFQGWLTLKKILSVTRLVKVIV